MDKKVNLHIEAIKKNAVDVLVPQELRSLVEEALGENRPLKLKIGFDPTARDIHLGHTVLLKKLRRLQDLGYEVIFIIGDFTAKIGDPSGRITLRPILSDEEIRDNARTYTEQAFKILDKEKTRIVYNSQWYAEMKLSDFLSLLSSYTVARMLERDDFAQRMKEKRPLTILEFAYPIIQGYDSVKVEADIEFGGTDQKFNLIVGRHLQEVMGQRPQGVVTMPLLVGLDGKSKMSKSLGNYIGITENSKSMFGKLMSIPDEVMWEYFRLLTEEELGKVKKMHPKEAKLLLAETIVSFYHSEETAKHERQEFERIFSERETPSTMPSCKLHSTSCNLIELLYTMKMVSSKNDARRLLNQGGISMIDTKNPASSVTLTEQEISIPAHGAVLKIGKKKFLKVIP